LASPRTSRILLSGVAHSRRAAMLMLTGLLASRSPLPYTAVAVVPLAWSGVELVLSIRDRTASRSVAQTTPLAAPRAPSAGIASCVVGLVLVCALAVTVLLPYAFYGPLKSLQDCLLGANTAIATGDCMAGYNRVLSTTVGGLLRIGQHAGG
jgi:hypothetical protein